MKIFNSTGIKKIFFTSPGNTEGLTDVKLTLIQHDGTTLLSSVSMSEQGDGVYDYDYNFINDGWYLASCYSDSLGGDVVDSIRIGYPSHDYIYGVYNVDTTAGVVIIDGCPDVDYFNVDSTVSYEINTISGNNIDSGFMTHIGNTGIYWVDITGLTDNDYFFKMDGIDTVKFKVPLTNDVISAYRLCLEKNYNISVFGGTGEYNFDSTGGVWIKTSGNVENTKASDLFYYIKYHYPNTNVRYIKSYYEYPNERFKIFIPEVTPENNENNFPLVELNQVNDPERNAFYCYLDQTSDYIVIQCK